MELSESIDGIIYNFDKSGINLFYNKFKYKFVTPFKGIYYVQNYYNLSNKNVVISILQYGADLKELTNFVFWRKNVKIEKQIRCKRDFLTIYFNDPEIIKDFLEKFPDKKDPADGFFRKKLVNYQKNVIYLKNPLNKLRVFLNPKSLNLAEATEFYRTMQDNQIKICPTLHNHIIKFTTSGAYRQRYNLRLFISYNRFIDFDDPSILTLLALKYPQIMGKIYKLEPR